MAAYLATITDNIDLLNTSIEKENALLAREKKELEEIEKNAKNVRLEKGRQMKNVRNALPILGYIHATDMSASKEHPVLRQLDNLLQGQAENSAAFTISGSKSNPAALAEVRTNPLSLYILLSQD